MFIEIEATVYFLASHLYGRLPRSRVDAFSEYLANGLAKRLYQNACRPATHFRFIVKSNGCGDSILHRAAAESFLNVNVMLGSLPSQLVIHIEKDNVCAVYLESGEVKQIYPNQKVVNKENSLKKSDETVLKKRSMKQEIVDRMVGMTYSDEDGISTRRPQFHVEFSLPSGFEKNTTAVPQPYFEVQHEEQIYTALAFAATRFGSTKLKAYEIDASMGSRSHRYSSTLSSVNIGTVGSHPFTMPSLYAYLQLLVFLNAIACISMLPEDQGTELQMGEEMTNVDMNSDDSAFSLTSLSTSGSVTPKRGSVSSKEADALTDQFTKCSAAYRKAFGSQESGAYCVRAHEIFAGKSFATHRDQDPWTD